MLSLGFRKSEVVRGGWIILTKMGIMAEKVLWYNLQYRQQLLQVAIQTGGQICSHLSSEWSVYWSRMPANWQTCRPDPGERMLAVGCVCQG